MPSPLMPASIDVAIHREGKDRKKYEHYVPTLFIGLGGSGKDALMRLRKRFYDEYADRRFEFVRYLMIDTDMERWWPGGESTEDEYSPVRPKANEILNCQISEANFIGVFDRLEKTRDVKYIDWLKPEMRNYGARAVQKGAGTHRQFGRMAFMLNFDLIKDRIISHLEAIVTAAAEGNNDDGASIDRNTIEIVIVTSLAGGTGSGMFLDTAYLLKDILQSHDSLSRVPSKYCTLISVLPRAFQAKADANIFHKFQQNAYASLLEMEYYGTPRTGDELFVGQSKSKERDSNRVGFKAPWQTIKGNPFIEGQGWEACYLVDNVNPLSQQSPLDLSETFQMIADYLFLDFQRSEFAIQKRSNRCNLAQYQEDSIETRVHKLPTAVAGTRGVLSDLDIVYASSSGCTFSSFGLAEIGFDRDGVYRAASYRLASNLIYRRWLADPRSLQTSDYQKLTKEDMEDPKATPDQPEPPIFRPDFFVRALYQASQGNWVQSAQQDLDAVRTKPFTGGGGELRRTLGKHSQLVARGPSGMGQAAQTIGEQERLLSGSAEALGPVRQRLRNAARARVDAQGVSVAKEVLNYYRQWMQMVGKKAAEFEKDGTHSSTSLARLEEADGIYFPARKMAQRIEYPRACEDLKSQVLASYRRGAAQSISRLMHRSHEYIGSNNQKVSPELERHRTLLEYLENSEQHLRKIAGVLDERFRESRQDEGTPRCQALAPSEWDESKYDDQINRALLGYPEVGPDEQGRGPNWGRVAEKVLDILRTEGSREFAEIRTLTDLIDFWFAHHQVADKNIKKIAETIASACRTLLHKANLNLNEFFDGSVMDLLMIKYGEGDRKKRIERLIRASAPYFPMDIQAQASMTGNFRPVFDNLLGKKAGQIPQRSEDNERDLMEEIESLSLSLQGDQEGAVKSRLEGSPSALILCREVWGVPLQYYSFIDTLHRAYMDAGPRASECHISYRQGWEELPDVRVIDPTVYEKIRDNIEHILFAMICGTITYKDGRYIVMVPDPLGLGVDPFDVGSRISRIIKKCCEDNAIREHLHKERADWEHKATPKQWAIFFASAFLTYEYSRQELHADSAKHSSPLRNCFSILVIRFQDRLKETVEGLAWLELLRGRDPAKEAPEHVARREETYKRLVSSGLLFQASKHVPVYEVNWDKADQFQLPEVPVRV